MLVGTVALPLLLPRVTSTPLGPAGAESVTVPVEGEPPVTGFGFRAESCDACLGQGQRD